MSFIKAKIIHCCFIFYFFFCYNHSYLILWLCIYFFLMSDVIRSSFTGGDKILMGAGGSVEPFWALYAVHKNPHVLKLFEDYRIG